MLVSSIKNSHKRIFFSPQNINSNVTSIVSEYFQADLLIAEDALPVLELNALKQRLHLREGIIGLLSVRSFG